MSETPIEQPVEDDVRDRETTGEGTELTTTEEPNSFEPEEDPEAVDEEVGNPT